jgi:hypothetical protein
VHRAADDPRDVVGLLADLGHRRRLPEVAPAERADREERERLGQRADDPTVVGRVDAQAGGSGTDHPGLRQPGQQRVGGDGPDGTGAVDDRGDPQRRAVVERHLERAGTGVDGGERAAVPLEPARGGDGGEPACGRGRHPVPVHVPRAGVLGDEPALVGLRQPAPQLRGDRSEAVDRGAPVAGRRDRLVDVGGQRGAQRVEVRDARDAGRRRDRGSGGQHVRLRQGVGARDDVDGAVGPVGADREVDHREARAQHEHVADLGDPLCPRVGDETGVGGELRWCPAGAGTTAGRQHDGTCLELLAVGQLDDEPLARTGDVDDLRTTADEPGVARELGRRGEQALDVAPERRAGREVVGLERRVVVVAQPPQEVLGVARERAHPGRRHVEEVAVIGRGVGLAATRGRGRVDELDAEARGERGHQVRRDERPTRSGPDNDDPAVTLVRPHVDLSLFSSELLD